LMDYGTAMNVTSKPSIQKNNDQDQTNKGFSPRPPRGFFSYSP
jgi:hypothetical protein